MFFFATQLFQLAFSNETNGLYSTLLILAAGSVLYQWLRLRKTQQHWNQQWTQFHRHCLDRTVEPVTSSPQQGAAGQHPELADLRDYLQIHSSPPPASVYAESRIRSAQVQHVMLAQDSQFPPIPNRWPFIALGLGTVGMLWNLTILFSATNLPTQAQHPSLFWLSIISHLGATLWPLICGVIVALLCLLPAQQKHRMLQEQEISRRQLHQELTSRIEHDLYPNLAKHGLFDKHSKHSDDATSWQTLQTFLNDTQLAQESLWKGMVAELHETLQAWQPVQDMLRPLTEQSTAWQAEVTLWMQCISEMNEQLKITTNTLHLAFQPIEHAQQLLQERMTSLLRQQDQISINLDKLLAWEERLPERLHDMLRHSLHPAHRMLQTSSQSLHQSLELLLARNSQERVAWRSELKSFTERLQILERISQDHGHVFQELTQITQHLAEIAEHIRFRPRPDTATTEENHSSPSLDHEIEQILQDLGHRQPS